jgi:hypothetical protein
MPYEKRSQDLQIWIDARRRFRLSHAHVQMARELGMNPKKLGKLDNHDQEPWKRIYAKRFGKERPPSAALRALRAGEFESKTWSAASRGED